MVTKDSIEWQHTDCSIVVVRWFDSPGEVYCAGTQYLSQKTMHNTRIPAGHPEGYIGAFANIYRNFTRTVRAKRNDEECSSNELGDFPDVKEGVRGMVFIETCVANGRNNNEKWIELKE